ncbi:hypothetical protein L6452_05456 [Arctium lappa]|uniref:Uncharacterized protein n=1 Tax=Arctium lappa TaxID=4217 RepID=A0ACB9EGF7_ARCLA|nr:hypothetical protein L6452_05456 [Arctium lappa]
MSVSRGSVFDLTPTLRSVYCWNCNRVTFLEQNMQRTEKLVERLADLDVLAGGLLDLLKIEHKGQVHLHKDIFQALDVVFNQVSNLTVPIPPPCPQEVFLRAQGTYHGWGEVGDNASDCDTRSLSSCMYHKWVIAGDNASDYDMCHSRRAQSRAGSNPFNAPQTDFISFSTLWSFLGAILEGSRGGESRLHLILLEELGYYFRRLLLLKLMLLNKINAAKSRIKILTSGIRASILRNLMENTAESNSTLVSKVPMLRPNEFDMWNIRIKQYILLTDYSMWDIIENGPSDAGKIGEDGKRTPPKTDADRKTRQTEMKALSTLLLAIPNEYQHQFCNCTDAQMLWNALEKRFSGTKSTKRNQKAILKKQYENFMSTKNEFMTQTFDRFNKLIGELATMGVQIDQDDVNRKFLRSLGDEWTMYTVSFRQSDQLEEKELDDLYNDLRVFEAEVEAKKKPSGYIHNAALLSASIDSTANPESVNAANGANQEKDIDSVFEAFLASHGNSSLINDDLEQLHPDDLEEMDIKWQMTMLSMRVKKFIKRTGRNNFSQRREYGAGFDKSKVECYKCHLKGHFARECRSGVSHNNNHQQAQSGSFNNNRSSAQALVSQQGMGFDWSDQTEEAIQNQTLMAEVSDLPSEVNSNLCSKTCIDTVKRYRDHNQKMSDDLKRLEKDIKDYVRIVERFEEQIKVFQANELQHSYDTNYWKWEKKDLELKLTKSKEESEKLRDELTKVKLDVEKFSNASKAMDSLLQTQIHDKLRRGIGYNATPPPYNNNYIPPTSELLETKDRKDLPEGATEIDPLDEVVVEDKTEKEVGKSKENKVSGEIPEENNIITNEDCGRAWIKSKDIEKTERKHMKKKSVKESVNMWVPKSTKNVSTATTNSVADNDSVARSNTTDNNVSIADIVSTSSKVNTANSVSAANKVSTAQPVSTANSVSASKGNQQLKGKSIWHVDSGCSRHMTGNMSCLKNFKKIDGGHVAFGNTPDGGKISGKGDVSKGKMTFEDVFYVEQLRYNLLSVSQVCDKQHSILFTDYECIILAPGFKVVDETMILLRTPRKDNVYCLDMESVSTDSSLNCLVSKASLDESSLWHRRMCHMNFKTMNKLVKNNLVRGLPSKVFSCDDHCVACLEGKQYKTSHKSKELNTISNSLQLLHLDLFGPTNVMSISKKSYCLVIVDDYSRFTWVYFLRTKDETSGLIKSFILRIENQTNQKVKVIRSDNGTEFKNHDLNTFCEEKGIERQYSAPRTPQQNGVAERRNRTLIEAVRSLLADSKLPITLWAEAVNTACYVQNRVLVVKPKNKTPYELLNNRKPFIGFFKPFGCPCTILNTKTHLGKFDSKADDGFLVGYSSQSKAYRVFNTSSRIIEESDNVKCNENTPNPIGSGPQWLFDIDSLTNSLGFSSDYHTGSGSGGSGDEQTQVQDIIPQFVIFPIPTIEPVDVCEKETAAEPIQSEEDGRDEENHVHDEPEAADEIPSADFNDSNLDVGINEEPSHQTRTQKNHPPELVIGDISSPMITRNQSRLKELQDQQHTVLSCFLSQIEPKKVFEAMKDSSWIEAMQEELLQFKLQEVWDLVDLPKGHRAIGTKWIFRNKKDERGIVIRNKARLVAQGYTQEEGIDNEEVFAPVARVEAIRLFLAYASYMKFKLFRIMAFQGTQDHVVAQMNMELTVARARIDALTTQARQAAETIENLRNQNGNNMMGTTNAYVAMPMASIPFNGYASDASQQNSLNGTGYVPLGTSNGVPLDPVAQRLKLLEEQNERVLSMLAKLPGAAVPVDVEPRTEFQASPFVDEIALVDVPKKYSIPTFSPKYSGVTDPTEHVAQYKQLMWTVSIPHQFQEVCMCKSFGATLTGAALQWLINLKPKTIGSFAELVNQFTQQFASSRKMEKQTSDLYYVVQKTIEAYKRGLDDSSGLYLDLTKYPPETFEDVRARTLAHMRVEDDLAFRNKHSGDRKSLSVKKPDFKPKSTNRSEPTRQISNVRFEKKGLTTSKSVQYPKVSSYGFPGSAKDVVVSLKQLQQNVRWPKKSDKDNDKKDKTKWCDFHDDFGHITEDCIALKKELSWLNSKGYLQELKEKKDACPTSPEHAKVMNCITGGSDICGTTYSAAKRHASRGPDDRPIPKEARLKEDAELEAMPLTFDQADLDDVHQKHHDGLIIQLSIGNCLTKRILVDGGSSANIIFFDAVKAMGIDKSKITRRSTTLVGFNGGATNTMGEITLPVYAKGINRQTKFNVVDCSSAYNVILGRPWIHDMKAVPSTYHQTLKFPTQWGVQEIKGERKVARECYKVSLKPPKQTDHYDCFAWTHEDMVGIDPSIISHKLNIDPSFKPVQQKRRKFAPERNKVINDEVDNLLKTGKIREVKYPDWLANVVVVQKKNGKWRVCIDFTDLNKACPKDPFPLPHIDSMVDATAGHELLTFMDAYSGYNQILMHSDDQEKTAFMTDKGIYCYKVMPFGLKNAGSTYQRLVNMMFKEHLGDTMEVYIDDMLVKSKHADDHIGHLKQSFDILREYKMKLNPTKCSFGVRAGKFLGYMVTRRGIEANPEQIKAIVELKSPRNFKEVQRLTGRVAALNRFISRSSDRCEVLQLYLAVSNNSVSAVLIRETDGRQLPIYYVSKTLLDAETSPELESTMTSDKLIVATLNDITWTLDVDGSANIRGTGLGVVLQSPQGGKMVYSIRCDFKATNNEAEYEALIAGIKIAHELGATRLHVRSDSSLVVNQINGEFAAKDSRMIAYYKKVKEEAKKFSHFVIEQIPRDQNTQADALANLGSALSRTTFDNIPIVHLATPSIKEDDNISVAPIEEENSWSDDIRNYLEHDQLPDDKMEARKIRFKASRYVMIRGQLYRRSSTGLNLRCITSKGQVHKILQDMHDGECGNHSGSRSLANRISRQGYYWPTIRQDATRYV